MAFNDNENPIFDCGRQKPMRVRVFRDTEDGKPVTRAERRPQGKYLMVIDSYGHEVPLKLHNAISEQAPQDPYLLATKAAKLKSNAEWGTQPMIPSEVCPQQTEYQFLLPPHLHTGKRCETAVDGHPVGEDRQGNRHWCKCITRLVDERRKANAELEGSRDPATTIQQALLNNSQETTKKLTELLANLSAKVEADDAEAKRSKDKR